MILKRIFILSALLCLFARCNDDFLDRPDLDTISSDLYWRSTNDLKLYVNKYYSSFPGWNANQYSGGIYWADVGSDNMIQPNVSARLAGNSTVETGNGAWNFANIRAINIFMANYEKVEDDFEKYKHYVGEALFFRAYYNFQLLVNYGSYPYSNELLTDTSEELYAPRTPRNEIAQNIIADLDLAAEYMNSGKQSRGNRLCKEVAQLFKARVAIFEGTWEKYHAGTEYGVSGSDGSSFLTIAAAAANDVISSGHFDIYDTDTPESDYSMVFNQPDYSTNSEVMLWQAYDASLSLAHNGQRYLADNGGGRGISKSLVDEYLCTDGEPIATSALYQGDDDLPTVSANRDLRLSQTIWLPGQPMNVDGANVLREFILPDLDKQGESLCVTGYQIRKGANPDIAYKTVREGTTSSPIFRYAEALLIYAEAKAELGTITQADVDLTINKLRDRAGMPDLNLASIVTDPNWAFPTLSPIINEIRREWRVEFAAEGYRFNDMLRWAAFDELVVGKRIKGAKFKQSDFPDMEVGTHVLLDENGYVDAHQNEVPSGMQFVVTRDYLLPVPQQELTLNPDLTQNPGWKVQ